MARIFGDSIIVCIRDTEVLQILRFVVMEEISGTFFIMRAMDIGLLAVFARDDVQIKEQISIVSIRDIDARRITDFAAIHAPKEIIIKRRFIMNEETLGQIHAVINNRAS